MWEFFVQHFWTIASVLGALTGIGTIGIIIFLGIPGVVILAKLIDLFKAAVAFFSTPIGQAVGVGLLCAGFFWAGLVYGAQQEAKLCREADARAQLQAIERDATIDKATAERAARDADELRGLNDSLQTKVNDYELALAKKPAVSACRLDNNDVRRLRNIAR